MYQYDLLDILIRVILPGLRDTLIMLIGSAITCWILGFVVGLVLITTRPAGAPSEPHRQ